MYFTVVTVARGNARVPVPPALVQFVRHCPLIKPLHKHASPTLAARCRELPLVGSDMAYESHLWAPSWAFTPPLGTPPKRHRAHTDTHTVTQAAGPRTLQVTDTDTDTQAQFAVTQAQFAVTQELLDATGNLADAPCTQHAHKAADSTLSTLPDDVLGLVLDACSGGAGVPRFEEDSTAAGFQDQLEYVVGQRVEH